MVSECYYIPSYGLKAKYVLDSIYKKSMDIFRTVILLLDLCFRPFISFAQKSIVDENDENDENVKYSVCHF